MVEESIRLPRVWVRYESAVISARFHDLERFSPDYLRSAEIVEPDWVCHGYERSASVVNIRFGPTFWRMNRENLWMNTAPQAELGRSVVTGDMLVVPLMINRVLARMPDMPFRRLWLYWQVFLVESEVDEWMLQRLVPLTWPKELNVLGVEPSVIFELGSSRITLAAKKQTYRFPGEQVARPVVSLEFSLVGGGSS